MHLRSDSDDRSPETERAVQSFVDAVLEQLQPVLDSIAASLQRGERAICHDVSVELPSAEGQMLLFSIRGSNRHRRGARSRTTRLDDRQLGLVTKAILDNLDAPLSVSTLSSIAGLSRSHFSHAFRATVGSAPHAHIIRLRIERAMTLMRESEASLSEIALATGFSDHAHFSNTFRLIAGATPTIWRRRYGMNRDKKISPVA